MLLSLMKLRTSELIWGWCRLCPSAEDVLHGAPAHGRRDPLHPGWQGLLWRQGQGGPMDPHRHEQGGPDHPASRHLPSLHHGRERTHYKHTNAHTRRGVDICMVMPDADDGHTWLRQLTFEKKKNILNSEKILSASSVRANHAKSRMISNIFWKYQTVFIRNALRLWGSNCWNVKLLNYMSIYYASHPSMLKTCS